MFTPLQVPCAQHITLPICTYEKLAHTYGFGRWGVFVFHPSVLSGCWTEQPSPECSLLPVQVPSSDFYKNFSKEVQVSQWYSRVSQSVWSSHMVEKYDHLLPISKADMWSLWVGRRLHTLVTCIAQPKGDPSRGWYLAKFRSHGTWDIWRVWRNEVDSFPVIKTP